MHALELITISIQLLAFVGFGFFLIRSLLIFRERNIKGTTEFPPVTWFPMFEFPYAILAPMIHWRKNRPGRICLIGIVACALTITATFVIQNYLFQK